MKLVVIVSFLCLIGVCTGQDSPRGIGGLVSNSNTNLGSACLGESIVGGDAGAGGGEGKWSYRLHI